MGAGASTEEEKAHGRTVGKGEDNGGGAGAEAAPGGADPAPDPAHAVSTVERSGAPHGEQEIRGRRQRPNRDSAPGRREEMQGVKSSNLATWGWRRKIYRPRRW